MAKGRGIVITTYGVWEGKCQRPYRRVESWAVAPGEGAYFYKSPKSAAFSNSPTVSSASINTPTSSRKSPTQVLLSSPKSIPKCSSARSSFPSLSPPLIRLLPWGTLLRRCVSRRDSNVAKSMIPQPALVANSSQVKLPHSHH